MPLAGDTTDPPSGAGSGVAVDPWFDGQQARVAWRWANLWRWRRCGELHLREVSAQTLRLRLERDANGVATWQPPRSSQQEPAANDEAPMPRVDLLAVGSGDIVLNDVLTAARLAITLRAAGGDAASPAPQTGPATSLATGGYRATIDGRWRQLSMSLGASTSALLPLPLLRSQGAAKLPLSVQGTVGAATIGFDGTAAALLGDRELEGAITLSGPSLARVGAPLGSHVAADAAVRVERPVRARRRCVEARPGAGQHRTQPSGRRLRFRPTRAGGAIGPDAFAQAAHRQHRLLLDALDGHEAHVRTTRGLADRCGVVGVVVAGEPSAR